MELVKTRFHGLLLSGIMISLHEKRHRHINQAALAVLDYFQTGMYYNILLVKICLPGGKSGGSFLWFQEKREVSMADMEDLVQRRRNRAARKRRRARYTKRTLLTALAVTLVVAAAVWFFGFHIPYLLAENTMPENGSLLLQMQEDGTVQLTWSAGWNADYYVVQLLPAQGGQKAEPLFSATVKDGKSCVLTTLPQDQELTLRVQSAKCYKALWWNRIRLGTDALESSGYFPLPTVENISWALDPDEDQVEIQYDLTDGVLLQLCVAKNGDEERRFQVLDTEQVCYTFGEEGDYPAPDYGETYEFIFRPYLQRPGMQFYGLETTQITVKQEDFLGTVLKAQCQYLGNNQYTLTWNETKGDHYEIQSYDSDAGEWVTISRINKGEPRAYTTSHLQRYTDYRFRVVAIGKETLPDSDYSAVSNETSVMTGASLIYSTIWPIQDLKVYSDTEKTQSLGTAPGGAAYCVLDEADGLFRILFGDGYGYIDSNYCMINLPEYLGDLCSYNITNSYSSLYMVHGYEIPGVTDKVVRGYEDIRLADGTFVVPLLYPTAKKLEQAAFTVMNEGLRIKIYDSFRPQEASQFVYGIAKDIYDTPLPETTYRPGDTEEPPAEPTEPVEGEEPAQMTYGSLMTDNGRYPINYFIANTTSKHNLGVAMDMTLEWADSGQELRMQTDLHDLSYYSELANNTLNANWLSEVMHDAGFGGLVSEWWHFQDNEARSNLNLTPLKTGVSLECWMADDNGWRYRDAGGNYYTDCQVTIGGRAYAFDTDGYALETAWQAQEDAAE